MTDRTPTRFLLRSLGRLELLRDGAPILARRRKELALLTHLARRGPRPVDRRAAASLLWGDRDEGKARVSLRQALFELKAVLGDRLEASADSIRIDPAALDLDANEFEAEVARGEYAAAADRWRGEFLEGLEDLGDDRWVAWLEGERAGLQARYAAALTGLAARAEADSDWDQLVRWSERHLEIAPYEEEVVARLVRGCRAGGRMDEAAAAIARFRDRLRRDLDTEPSAAFLAQVQEDDGGRAIGRPGVRGLVSPDLVGRETVLEVVRRTWQEVALGGAGRVLFVDGPAGAGKTRLLGEIEAEVSGATPAAVVATTRAFESERRVAWSTVRPLIASLVQRAKGVLAVPPDVLAVAAATIPEVAERFPSRLEASAEADPTAALTRLVAEVAAEQPVALLVDDALDADPASTGLEAELVRRPPSGLLLVLVGRAAVPADHPLAGDLARDGGSIRRLRLGPLAAPDIERLVGSMAPWVPGAAAAVARAVFLATGGNPGLATAAVHELAEVGVIGPGRTGAWECRAEVTEARVSGLGSVQSHVDAARRRLTVPARRLLETAAVAGPIVDAGLLESLSGLDAASFRAALGELLAGRQLGDVAGRPEQYQFPSEGIRLGLAASLAPSDRRGLHRRIADALAARGATAAEVRRHLEQAGGPGRSLGGRGLVAAGLVALVAAAGWWLGRPATTMPPGTGVLLATPENATGDSMFTALIPVVAQASLQQSGRVWIAPPNQVAAALARMGRSDTILRGELAREVALRANLPVVAAVRLTRSGSGYLASAHLVLAANGREVAIRTAPARTADAVADAIRTVAGRVLEALGEEGPGVTDSLPALTTGSLPALQWFALGEAAWNRRDWPRARAAWERALSFDSSFAMAHLMLGNYAIFPANDPAAARAHFQEAARLGARLGERERLELAANQAQLDGSFNRAIEARTMLAARFPSPVTVNNLGTSLMRAGRCGEAIPVLRRAAALDPNSSLPHLNLATCYQALDSLSRAIEEYLAADRRDSTALYRDNLNQEWGRALFLGGRPEAAESVFRIMAAQPNATNQARGLRSLAYLAMSRGRFADAREFLGRSTERYQAASAAPFSLFRNELLAAEAAAALEDHRAAARHLARADELAPSVRDGALSWANAVLAAVLAGDPSLGRRWLPRLETAVTPRGRADSAALRLARAAVALEAGAADEAARLLVTGPPDDLLVPAGPYWVLRGRAQLALGRPDSAMVDFREAERHVAWGSEMQRLWERTPGYLAEAAMAAGDSGQARAALSELLQRWKTGDTTAAEWRRAARLLARLQRSVDR